MRIETQRLLLRKCTIGNVTSFYIAALNDPAIVGLTEARHKFWDRESVKRYIQESNRGDESALIGIFLKTSDKHIGNIHLFNIHRTHRRAEFGILLFDPSEWHKGYGTEAVDAVVSYAFKELGLHRIYADYYAVNDASAALFKKAGFVIEGIFKDHFYTNDGYVDSVRIAKLNPAHE